MLKKTAIVLAFLASVLITGALTSDTAHADGNQTPPIPVIAGTGIVKTGHTLSADATYLQRIVSGTCAAGSSIREMLAGSGKLVGFSSKSISPSVL